MKTQTFKVTDQVMRLGSPKNYTTGRTGIIVDINDPRIRVKWILESSGRRITTCNSKNGVRTWVNKKFLTKI